MRLNRFLCMMFGGLFTFVLSSMQVWASENQNDSVQSIRQGAPVIVVDAGHGGRDSGARGINGIQEKDINLAVANDLVALLRETGFIVGTTRQGDHDLATEADRLKKQRHRGDLKGRLQVIQRYQPDIFVSIHCNADPSPEWRGAHVLYKAGNEQGEELAKLIQVSFQKNILPTKREIDDNRSLFLLKRVPGAAVLAEIGFVTNSTEGHMLRQTVYQKRIAFAIYEAILVYVGTKQTPIQKGQLLA